MTEEIEIKTSSDKSNASRTRKDREKKSKSNVKPLTKVINSLDVLIIVDVQPNKLLIHCIGRCSAFATNYDGRNISETD